MPRSPNRSKRDSPACQFAQLEANTVDGNPDGVGRQLRQVQGERLPEAVLKLTNR